MRALAGVMMALLVVGCGGGSPDARTADDEENVDFSPEDDAIFGNAPEAAGPLEPEQEPGETEVPAGPTELTVEVKLGTDEYGSGEVAIQDSSGASVAQGRPGQTFTLPAGDYTVVARATDEDDIIGAPVEGSESISLAGQEEHTVRVHIPAAQVKLNVSRNGRRMPNPHVTLFREGSEEPVASFRAGDRHITIVPGRYEANVRAGNNEIRVRGLTFMEGAMQNIPVNVQ